jgi:hypothetical protein
MQERCKEKERKQGRNLEMKGESEEINKQTSISPLTQLGQHIYPSHMITVFKTFNY